MKQRDPLGYYASLGVEVRATAAERLDFPILALASVMLMHLISIINHNCIKKQIPGYIYFPLIKAMFYMDFSVFLAK